MSGYEQMGRIIRHLDQQFLEQPSLEELAEIAGLSPAHFHRKFVSWVGITPKDFLQCLTLEHARDLLNRGDSVLDAALDSGLSGPGRLHDLCVTLEAASPGEIKTGGADLTLIWGSVPTPFGTCLVAESPRGICHLSFQDGSPFDGESIIQSQWPSADLKHDDAIANEITARMFSSSPAQPDQSPLRLWIKGTEFQIRVWRALLNIPRGSLSTYRRVAESIGQPKASRAVGKAIGSNDIAVLIPCHRVIRETGAVTGYRWGVGRKRAFVAWESAKD